jgi:hypothetical protein
MPTFSQGSRSSLSYIVETTFGTTPVGNFKNLPFTSHSLDLTKERVQGNNINADRMPRVDRHGNRQVGGDIVVDLASDDYDDFIASAMLSTWSTAPAGPDVIKVGTTPRFMSIEDYAADIDQARLFTGCTVSTMGVSIAPNQMVTTTFGIVGKDMSVSINQRIQTASANPAPFTSDLGSLSIGNVGSLTEVNTISSLEFSVDNSFSPTFVIGSTTTPTLQYGMATVEGTFTAYWEDVTLVNRFLNETESAISISVDDPTGSNEYTFFFPRIKINGAAVPVGGPESRMIEVPFVALFDSTQSSNLVISRPETA